MENSNAKVQQALEVLKLDYQTYKHLTTLSTGSILLIVTLLDKLFDNPEWIGLAILSICSFFVCVVASVSAMFFTSMLIQKLVVIHEDITPGYTLFAFIIVWLASGGFLLGIGSLVAFAFPNFLN